MLRILTLFSCIFVSMSSFADDQTETREAKIIQALTELSAQLPQQYLSLDAVADHNDYDAETIISWVGENIQYSPSPGYQLTPENALLTATGNALEQAMLLQNVLTQAGFEVRIAQTLLDEATAATLLKQSFVSSPAKQWELNSEIRNQYLKTFAILYEQPENALLDRYNELSEVTPWNGSKLFTDSGELADALYRAIDKKNAWKTPAPESALKPWIEIARNYYFVKYRLAQGDEWLQAHPAFVEAAPVVENSTYFSDDIAGQYHQITLQAFITRQTDEKIETIAVTPPIKRNSVQLFEHQLTYSTVPSNYQAALAKRSLELLYESNFFIPFVDGGLLDNTRAFGLDGRDYAAKDILDSNQKFIDAVEDNATRAGSTLGSLAKPKSKPESDEENTQADTSMLLDYYFEIGWQSPSGESRKLKRTIYQRGVEKTNRSALNDITQSVLLAAEPAILSPAVQFNEQLKAQITVFKLFQKGKKQGFSETQAISHIHQWYNTQKDLRFSNTLNLSRQGEGTGQSFSASAMLAMIWEREDYETEAGGTITFDYLINAAQTIKRSDSGMEFDVAATLANGVWSTYSEALVQAEGQQNGELLSRERLPQSVVSAAGQFNLALSGGRTFDVVTNAAELERLPQLDTALKLLLKTEFIDNPQNLYIIPKVKPDEGRLAFYRVDSHTGESLGYSVLGRGETQVSTLQLLGQSILLYNYITDLENCAKKTDAYDGFSCVLCATVVATIAVEAIFAEQAAMAVIGGFGAASVCKPSLSDT